MGQRRHDGEYLVMVSNEHEHRLRPRLELAQHSVEGLHRERAPRVPEVP
jgi:hypothetical protein